ncbi:MAG: hypothetical protein MUE41_08520 [Gemmatimonadaceae bacterium]|jgi:mono/diheme cytochrome c family protein|nr:hypothetical protein [Gemmatimonadaceae bacterium]
MRGRRRDWGAVVWAVVLSVGARVEAQPPPVALLADTAAGRRTFETVCSACHSIGRKEPAAPSMRVVVGRVQQRYPDRELFVRQVVRWAADPDSNVSVMPLMAREHFGLMLPVPLTTRLLENVATWLWMVDPAELGTRGRAP